MKKMELFGVKLSLVNMERMKAYLEVVLEKSERRKIVTPNVEHVVQAQDDRVFAQVINAADFAVVDGMGLVWCVKMWGWLRGIDVSNLGKVSGVDLMEELIKVCADKGLVVGLLGGKGRVGERLAEKYMTKNAGSKVVFLGEHKNIKKMDEEYDREILVGVKNQGVEVLFVAYGAPWQEIWIGKHWDKMEGVRVAMGVGGSFDYLAREVRRAPAWMQGVGLEWLYRLTVEPWRIWRQMRLVRFGWMNVMELGRYLGLIPRR